MTEKAKAVLVFGLSEPDANETEMVQALGYQVLMFKADISIQDAMKVDLPVELDLNDEEAVVAKAQALTERYDIRAVYTLNEYRVALAARVAQVLALPYGLPLEAALNCRNKKRTRHILAERDAGAVAFRLVRTPEEARVAAGSFQLPVVVKPSNEAGSHFVAVCRSADEAAEAVARIAANRENWVGQELDEEVLLEEYLDGPEYSVEAVTVRGETTVLALTEKQTWGAVEAGHLVPARLSKADGASMSELVVGALQALGVRDAVTHTEVKVTSQGPRIVEVNARPGGDSIYLLVQAVTGYNLRELALHVALGGTLEAAPRRAPEASSAAIRFFRAEAEGQAACGDAAAVRALPEVRKLTLQVKPGQTVPQTTSNYNRLGYVIVHGDEQRHALEVAADIEERLCLRVEQNQLRV